MEIDFSEVMRIIIEAEEESAKLPELPDRIAEPPVRK